MQRSHLLFAEEEYHQNDLSLFNIGIQFGYTSSSCAVRIFFISASYCLDTSRPIQFFFLLMYVYHCYFTCVYMYTVMMSEIRVYFHKPLSAYCILYIYITLTRIPYHTCMYR